MRRFDYDDNEEFREDVDNFFRDSADFFEDDEHDLQQSVDFVMRDLNLRIMRTAIRMLEKSIWWKFSSLNTRLKMIDKTYKKLKKLQGE